MNPKPCPNAAAFYAGIRPAPTGGGTAGPCDAVEDRREPVPRQRTRKVADEAYVRRLEALAR